MSHKTALLTLCFFGAGFFYPSTVTVAEVKIQENKRAWDLTVDGKPFYIRGVGCGLGRGAKGEDYLRMARDLGANCVRTWGKEQGTQEYLDTAWRYGLRVDAGLWLNWPDRSKGISYIGDNDYKKNKRDEVLDYVRRFKDHPAVLMWNVGNEVIFFAKSEEERTAFCRFLESLVKDIHREDPAHPVIYSAAAYFDLSYLKTYCPSLDAIGANVYGSIRPFQSQWDRQGIDKPYIITEYGPALPADQPKDVNGRPQELGDYQKAVVYKDLEAQIQSFKDYNVGGFVFHLGETTQETMTWWNINDGSFKKQSYWAMTKAYTRQEPPFAAPKLKKLVLSRAQNLHPGEIIDVWIQTKEDRPEDLSYDWRLSTAVEGVLNYYVNRYLEREVIGSGSQVKMKMPQKPGVYRIYCFVSDKNGNVSSLNKTVKIARTEAGR